MTYCIQWHFVSLVWPCRTKANTSHMACMHKQRGGDNNSCYPRTKMGKVTGGSVSMEMAAVGSLHDVLHATVFQIIGIATYSKGEHF